MNETEGLSDMCFFKDSFYEIYTIINGSLIFLLEGQSQICYHFFFILFSNKELIMVYEYFQNANEIF